MNKLFLIICVCSLINSSYPRQITPSTRVALIDLTLRSPQSYSVFASLVEAVGMTVVFVHPSKNLARDLCGCDGALIAFDQYFLDAQNSSYTKLITDPLTQFIAQKNKLIGLLLSDQTINQENSGAVINFLKTVGLESPDNHKAIEKFLAHKKHSIPLYTTAQQSAAKNTHVLPTFDHAIALPRQHEPNFLANNLPLGILLSSTNNTRVFISSLADLTFADLHENSFLNPLDPAKRTALMRAIMRTFAYLAQDRTHDKKEPVSAPNYRIVNKLVNNTNKKLTCTMFKKQQGVYKWTSNGISCGWMSVDYDKEFIPTNVAHIAQTDFDVLWLELPIGLYHEPELFNEKINYFAQQLVNAYQKSHRTLPKIIIDFNLGAILQWHHYASEPIDLYGNSFKNIPAPLDFDNFWHPAVIEVFSNVIKNWDTITNGKLPIDGVLFNLYFWNSRNHRYVMPYYSNLIDISDTAWNYYTKRHPVAKPTAEHSERINYLVAHDKLEEYLATLEQAAFELGQQISTDLHTLLPCAMVGIYTNAPLDTWFYRGFARALGSPDRPLLWFTENFDFYHHQTWLANNKIHALHMSNILLHHFNNQQDIAIINRLAKSHDGLWYSRVSRIGEKYQPNKWWSAEATTMAPKQLIKLIGAQARKP